jgi:hypothetical protein
MTWHYHHVFNYNRLYGYEEHIISEVAEKLRHYDNTLLNPAWLQAYERCAAVHAACRITWRQLELEKYCISASCYTDTLMYTLIGVVTATVLTVDP